MSVISGLIGTDWWLLAASLPLNLAHIFLFTKIVAYMCRFLGGSCSIGQPGSPPPTGYSPRDYTYAYNDNGWLTSLTDQLSNVTKNDYYDNGQLKTLQLPKQVAANDGVFNRTYTYETTGLVSTVAEAKGLKTAGSGNMNQVGDLTLHQPVVRRLGA